MQEKTEKAEVESHQAKSLPEFLAAVAAGLGKNDLPTEISSDEENEKDLDLDLDLDALPDDVDLKLESDDYKKYVNREIFKPWEQKPEEIEKFEKLPAMACVAYFPVIDFLNKSSD